MIHPNVLKNNAERVNSIKKYMDPVIKGGFFAIIHLNKSLYAISGGNGNIVLWDFEKGISLKNHSVHSSSVYSIINLNPYLFATCGCDQIIQVWDHSVQCLNKLKGHTAIIRRIVKLPEENLIATSSDDNSVIIWDISKRDEKCLLKRFSGSYFNGSVFSLCYVERSIIAAQSSGDNEVSLFDYKKGERVRGIKLNMTNLWELERIMYRGTRYILCGTQSGPIVAHEFISGKLFRKFTGHSNYICEIVTVQDSGYFFSSSDDQDVGMFHMQESGCLQKFKFHQYWTRGLTIDKKNRVVSCAMDNSVMVLDTAFLFKNKIFWNRKLMERLLNCDYVDVRVTVKEQEL